MTEKGGRGHDLFHFKTSAVLAGDGFTRFDTRQELRDGPALLTTILIDGHLSPPLHPMRFHIGLFSRLVLPVQKGLDGVSNFAFNTEHHFHTGRLKGLECLGSAIPR